MDDKILVCLNNKKVASAQSDYKRVANRIQKIIDFLKSHDMKCDIEHAQCIIEKEGMSETFIKKEMPEYTENLPEAVRNLIDSNTDKVINELKKIAMEARESITNNCYHKVNYKKLKMVDDKVTISDEALEECQDFGAVYLDTITRKKVYNLAETALKALENLQKGVDEAEIKGVVPGYPFNAINRDLSMGYGTSVLIVNKDGKVHLNREAFQNIV